MTTASVLSGQDDAGETLIEVLISIIIIGIAVLAILGAVTTGSLLSGAHRDETRTEVDLKRVAERVKLATYVVAAPAGAYTSGIAGVSASSTAARCWPGGGSTTETPGSWPACTAANDRGLQLVDLTTASDGQTETTQVLKRRP